MKAKIVKFKNGKYGLRRGWIFKTYADIDDLRAGGEIFWWCNSEFIYKNAMISDLEELGKMIERYTYAKVEESKVIETVNLKVD